MMPNCSVGMDASMWSLALRLAAHIQLRQDGCLGHSHFGGIVGNPYIYIYI